MPQGRPWERYGGQAMPPPAIPRIIQGPPREPPPQTPTNVALDEEQLEAARLENERRRREAAAAIAMGTEAAETTAEERRAASFLRRAIGSNSAYEGTGVGPRSWAGETLHDAAPGLLNQLPANIGNSPERQVSDSAQREFIAATLRMDSGAAIPPEEFESQSQIYFPQPGDGPEAAAAKRAARRRAIEGLLTSSGRSVPPEVRQQYEQWLTSFDAAESTPGGAVGAAIPGAAAIIANSAQGGENEIDPFNDEILDIGPIGVGMWEGMPVDEWRRLQEERRQTQPPPNPGLGRQFMDSTQNTLAGIGQGLGAIPDAFASATGAVLGVAADSLPGVPEWFSDALKNPITIGGTIEQASPTPDDLTGRGVRFASQLFGGAASLPRRATNALADTVVGAVPMRPAANALAGRVSVMDDANALQIPMMPADMGGPTTRVLTAAMAQTPAGAAPIVNAANRTVDAGGRALGRMARRAGTPTTAEEAGEAATSGALRYRNTSRTEATQLYDRAAELAQGVRVVPQRAIQSLQRNISELSENPAGDEALGYLTTLRARIMGMTEGVTVAGIRGMRTQLRDRFYTAGLRGTDIERRVMGVVDDASDDVAEALTNAGRAEAAEVYRAADAAWAARADTLDNFLMPIIGRRGEKSGEDVFRALRSASSGNGVRLRRFMNALPEEDAGTVRATLINALGRSTSGRQNAAGDAFSLDTFLTRWNDLGPTARRVLFTGENRQAIQQLANVAEHTKAAGAYANRSRTGGVVMTGATASSGLGGLPLLGTVLAGQYIGGALLASPRVAQVLAKISTARTPRQARAAIAELSSAATRNPALATEIGRLQQRLMEAFATSPATRAAAEQDE
jgi:hypothetical protein